MERKGLADTVLSSVEERYEWQSFLGLLWVLDVSAVDPVLYQGCMTAAWQLREKSIISRRALMNACGLGFQNSSLELDLLLAALVRDEVLEPIPSAPFCFRVRAKNWTDPESAYAGDGRSALVGAVRQEQSQRFRILGELGQVLSTRALSEKRRREIRMEIARVREIYDATWLELANAIGGDRATVIRRWIEGSTEPLIQQLELPLGNDGISDREGEERCNK